VESEDEIKELKARLAKLEGEPGSRVVSPPKPQGLGCGGWVLGAFAVVVALYIIGTVTSGSEPGAASVSSVQWSPPEGYVLEPAAQGGAIATQWETPTRAECRGSGVSCFAVNVVTEGPCPRSLYASITLLGEGGDNMGWTNDTAQGVQAGERTRLVFRTHERGVQAARIAEINCY